MSAHRPPLEVERLLSENSLSRATAAEKRLSVNDQLAFKKSLAPLPQPDCDDDLIDAAEELCFGPIQTRSNKEVGRLLSLLDGLASHRKGEGRSL